jgi:hypothetical protein
MKLPPLFLELKSPLEIEFSLDLFIVSLKLGILTLPVI